MKGEIISTRTVMKKIAKDRKVIPELFVEIDKRIQERINFEKNKEIIEPQLMMNAGMIVGGSKELVLQLHGFTSLF